MIALIDRDSCLRAEPVLAHVIRGLERAYAGEPPSDADGAIPFAGTLALGVADERLTLEAYAAALSAAVVRLMEELRVEGITLLQLRRGSPWTSVLDHPALAAAGRAFRAVEEGKHFDGGVAADRESAAGVLGQLFHAVRRDMGLGEIYFALRGTPIVGSFCQYGNLHLEVYGDGGVDEVERAARRAGLAPAECDERWGEGGRIEGRRLRMEG
jgi:hypothetical protein